ncbi:MAG: lipoyl(octanoyl) transferase LipB [Thermodesulfobacteriota bacterium]
MQNLAVHKLGMIDYKNALELQLSLLEKRKHGEIGDTILLLEHPPTYTIGRKGNIKNLLIDSENLKKRGIHFERVSRGGDITFHGPGQLVGYPIIDLNNFNRDVYRFLRKLEEAIILTLSEFGINGERVRDLTGVWVGEEKIASIGVGIKKWITYHGFALNVNTDLTYFDNIVACGIPKVEITSMERKLGTKDGMKMIEVENSVIKAFKKTFNMDLNWT